MTGVLMPEFKSANKAANYLANHNRLSFAIVASSGDLFNMGSNRVLNGDSTEGSGVPASSVRGPQYHPRGLGGGDQCALLAPVPGDREEELRVPGGDARTWATG